MASLGRALLALLLVWFGWASPTAAEDDYYRLSWPNYLLGEVQKDDGTKPQRMIAAKCLVGSTELEHEIEDRLGKDHEYTLACQITESLFVILAENGGNRDPLSVLDITRPGRPIELMRGLPWVERILKDKSGTLHIVVGGAVLRLGFYGSIVQIYSTKTWKGTTLARNEGIDNGTALECPEKGSYGYETMKQVLEEKHAFEDQNGDGFEDIVVETVKTSCSTHKSKTSTAVFLATEHGFKKAVPPRKPKVASERP